MTIHYTQSGSPLNTKRFSNEVKQQSWHGERKSSRVVAGKYSALYMRITSIQQTRARSLPGLGQWDAHFKLTELTAMMHT